MKSHALAAVIAVLLVVCLASPAMAQDNTQSQASTQPAVSSTDSTPTTNTQAQDGNGPPSPVDNSANTAATATIKNFIAITSGCRAVNKPRNEFKFPLACFRRDR